MACRHWVCIGVYAEGMWKVWGYVTGMWWVCGRKRIRKTLREGIRMGNQYSKFTKSCCDDVLVDKVVTGKKQEQKDMSYTGFYIH